jgi:uncharacterized membrane-anchored protein
MKNSLLTLFATLISLVAFSQGQVSDSAMVAYVDSVEKSFTYQHGTIKLSNGVGEINVPEGFKYLDGPQATKVLVDLWGNPPGENISLGMILPEDRGVISNTGYVFNVEYDEIGYVKDDDADDIDYDDLLTELKKETSQANQQRQAQGYEPITIVGWAAKPYYDSDRKILHWAKEVQFGHDSINTLNYNVPNSGKKRSIGPECYCQRA